MTMCANAFFQKNSPSGRVAYVFYLSFLFPYRVFSCGAARAADNASVGSDLAKLKI